MPRKPKADPSAPKAPRVRKKKADLEPKHDPPVYEHVIQNNGMMVDETMFTAQEFGYAYGSQPQFVSEAASSPYLIPAQTSTPQPSLMMRPMPNGGPQAASGMAPSAQPPMGPAPTPLEFRIHDMNRRLYIFNNSGISEKDYAQWWDAFSHEFFDDEARMWVVFLDDHNQPEKYVIGRQLIPRFFRSFVESGVKELYYVIRASSRESQHPNGLISFENENILQVTRVEAPCPVEVHTECKLYIEFTPYDEVLNHRIRTWTIELRNSQEFFVNELTKELQPADIEKTMPMTRLGLTQHTLNCLSVSRILEPMQLLMSHSKMSGGLDPRDTLRRTLFHHQHKMQDMHQRLSQPPMMPPAPVEETKPKPARKRTRKPAANAKNKKANASPAPSNPSFPANPMPGSFPGMGYQEVMVVGEPSMMGGDYGEEDERTISRVENSQYDPNALQMQQAMSGMGPGMMNGPNMGAPNGGTMNHMAPPNGMTAHGMGGTPGGPPMGQMGPPPNGMPPPYSFGQPPAGSWPSQSPNTTMITG